ncbi:MAG: hypothetical protein WA369_11480 [Candidatus Acidiferrales bacterium]
MDTPFGATTIEGKMVKVCLKGRCRSVEPTSHNGNPVQCVIQVELDRGVLPVHGVYDVRLVVPIEFAMLLEAGLPVVVTLEQDGG